MYKFIIPLLILSLVACEKSNEPEIFENKLIGFWNNPIHKDSTLTYTRTCYLDENEMGLHFLKDGIMYERKNAGWCATPPITYMDYRGIWIQKDSILEINFNYWGGQEIYTWKILDLNSEHLKILVIDKQLID